MKPSMKTLFPLVLDNTIMSSWAGCQTKTFYNHMMHLSSGKVSVHLHFGGAFAEGLEKARKAFYTDGKSEWEAVTIGQEAAVKYYGDFQPPDKSPKTSDRLWGLLEAYFFTYRLSEDSAPPVELADGTHGIEYSAMIELPYKHPELDIPLFYTGRLDMLVEYNGMRLMLDDKTTGGYFSKTWAKSWDTRSQFTGYSWLLKESGIDVRGALIRGCAILKGSYKFAECVTTRSDTEVEIWEANLHRRVEEMLYAYAQYRNGTDSDKTDAGVTWKSYNQNASNECNSFMRPCHYMDVCKNPKMEMYFPTEYAQHIWLPHEQRRMELGQYINSLENPNDTAEDGNTE